MKTPGVIHIPKAGMIVGVFILFIVVAFSVGAVESASAADNTSVVEDNDSAVVHQFGDGDVEVEDYEWDGNTIVVTVSSDSITSVAVTDIGSVMQFDEGESGSANYQTYQLSGGETRDIEFDVEDTGTRGITVAADGDMWVSMEETPGLFDNVDTSWNEVIAAGSAGVIFGAGIPLLITLITITFAKFNHRRVF